MNRFPPTSKTLSEHELDPYFVNFEASTRELELLLQGSVEKVNRRTLTHLTALSSDLMELGARYNGFALSEQSPTVAAAIERVGQAADNSYIETEELSSTLGATFSEPMRESAQFAGVVRGVLRYRILKRIQQEMTRDELNKKSALLDSLERSEIEAQRIEEYLNKSSTGSSPKTRPGRSLSEASSGSNPEPAPESPPANAEDTASIDSDFPPTHGEPVHRPSASQGLPHRPVDSTPSGHRKSSSGNFVTNKIFGRISHAIHGFADVDPERTRRDQIGKTRESLTQLEQALKVSEQDVKDASSGVLRDLKRFQKEKEDDLRSYMVAYARCHLDWARKSLETWTEARDEVDKIAVRGQLTFTTPSSKRRKVAAELRKAGGNKGLYFLKTSPPRKPKIGKRYGQSVSTSALSALPQRGFFTEPSSPSSPRLSPARSLQVDSSHGSANEQSSTEDWRSTTATSSPTVTDGESTQDTTCWPMSSSNNNRAAGQSAAAASDPPKEDVSMVDSSSSSSSGVGGSLDNGNSHTAPPAIKRPAAEMGSDEHDTVMQTDSPSLGSQEETEMSSNKIVGSKKQAERLNRHQRDASVDMVGKETESEPSKGGRKHASETSSSGTDPTSYTPSSSSAQTHASHDDNPSIDEQVAQVMQLMQQSPIDKQKGYIVSGTWLKRVLSRSSTHPRPDKADKLAAEGEIGPVDNSDLVLVTDPDTIFNDEAGEPFVPMRPGLQMGEDYEILPEEAWNLVMKWYGLSNQSPAIVRYAHNTNTEGDMEHIQYELNPPIFSILKLSPNPSEAEKSKPPVRFLASRHTPFQQWLKTAKTLASINMSTKTRVWRILEGLASSANVTPAASRSASPAPGTTVSTKIPTSISLGLEAFVGLTEGSQRELVDVQDHTANAKYNGRASIHVIGLGSDNVIVLEEQVGGPAGGEWLSETTKSSTNLTVGAGTKANVQNRLKNKSSSGSGRTSPAPSIVTRGRRRKDGKARGVTGLSNLGNTCYMNSALQCVRSVEELSHYFLMGEYKKDLNPNNPLSHNGDVAKAYANLLHQIFDVQGSASFAPRNFKVTIGRYGPSFSGYGQQDSQEFLLFLLDGLQEDLNRIQKKPYIEKPDSTDEMVHDKVALQRFADRCWEIYKARNDSVITDLFSGMYKSTVVCPECDKVSIIFDPFNNLTLQIPIENSWSHKIMFFPLHKPPVNIDVDIDKNSGIKAVKQFIAKKMNVNADRLVMAEIYKHKFYKLFDHSQSIADHQISEGDTIAMYELDSVPTSYNPDKPRRFRFSSEEPAAGFNSPKADRMLVPILNRGRVRRGYGQPQRAFFGVPMYVVISREEAYDYDAVLRRILARVANLTTRDILREDDGLGVTRAQQAGEDSDTVVMNEDDTQAYGQTIKASSVEGEDGLVDVSMRDADQDEAAAGSNNNNKKGADDEDLAPVLRPGSFIPPMLRNLFDVRYIATNDSEPTGFSITNEAREYPLMLSRVPDGKSSSRSSNGGGAGKTVFGRRADVESVASSDDELSGPAQPVNVMRTRAAVAADDEMSTNSSSAETKDDSGSETDSDRMAGATSLLRPGKARSSSGKQKAAKKPVQRRLPYVKPGDVIVLDWNEETYDGVFGDEDELYGDHDNGGGDGGLRGRPTWTNVSDVVDPEVTSKRQLRSRKKKRGITLDECLDEFGREEILSENDAWYCPRCKEHRRASKKFELWKAPDILVMHLKRFSANRIFRDKIDAVVDFPLELDMSGRVQMVEEGESMVYDLIAVDNHYGGLGGGHYTAYARNFVDGLWYEFNDSHVTMKRDPSSVVTSAAYLLFYRRRSDVPLGGSFLARLTEQAHDRTSDDSGSESGSGNGASGSGICGGGGGSGSGEGKRLGGLSRNGSSGALHGAAATRQSGDGGLPTDEEVEVTGSGEAGPDEDDEEEEEEGDEGFSSVRFHAGSAMYAQQPSWSYDRLANHGYGEDEIPRVFPPPGSSYADDGEGDDVASTQAERGEGDLSELDRSFELDADADPDADETGMVFSSIVDEEHAHGGHGHGSSPAMRNDFDDCPAVVEVRVDDE
ncbi:sorting nexin-41 [Trichophyton rubrum D6]|nr:sorting nexin-41 [Trichophyton rubrum CBS 289.86]EZF82449.1 sorting nexin-41 [Trichophyton rubrum MR1448]EZG14595.1 sorting nexin-41 [Trichophyton rubrum CBS 202.88]KDB31525.1 sorting nexin-41 [Trichophyton rubrum D6]